MSCHEERSPAVRKEILTIAKKPCVAVICREWARRSTCARLPAGAPMLSYRFRDGRWYGKEVDCTVPRKACAVAICMMGSTQPSSTPAAASACLNNRSRRVSSSCRRAAAAALRLAAVSFSFCCFSAHTKAKCNQENAFQLMRKRHCSCCRHAVLQKLLARQRSLFCCSACHRGL